MLNIKLYRQKPGMCGPASLKMVLEYYGIEKTEDELAVMAGYISTIGTISEGLIKAANRRLFKIER